MIPRRLLKSCVVAAGLCWAMSAAAQDDDNVDTTSLTCLSMNLVRQANAVDDRTVVFYLRDGRIYLNSLEQNCPGLRRNNRFSYNLRTGARIPRLCNTDTITVIEQSGTGFTCGLGRFQPISVGRVEELLRSPNEEPPIVTVTEIEETENAPEQEEPDEAQ